MRVLSCAFTLAGFLAATDAAHVGRVRGLVDDSEPVRKQRRLMVTSVGGGHWGNNGRVTSGSSGTVSNPVVDEGDTGGNSGGSGGGGGGGTTVTNPQGGGSGATPVVSPVRDGGSGGNAPRADNGGSGGAPRAQPKASKSKGASKQGRSIKGSQGGFRGGDDDQTGTTAICTCASCTTDVLNTMAGGYTCGERIDFQLKNNPALFPTIATACHQVGGLEFPTECGACDPFTCDGRTEPGTTDTHCNCETCTADAWNIDAGGYTCGARISWAMIVDQAQEQDACKLVTASYPQCKACNPQTCAVPLTAAPSIGGRSEPTSPPVTAPPVTPPPVLPVVPRPVPVVPQPVAPVTMPPVTAAPVTAAPVTAAPVTSSPTSGRSEPTTPAPVTAAPVTPAPVTAAPVAPPPAATETTPAPTAAAKCPEYCDCWSCAAAWNNVANGLTCGQRINWLIGTNIGEAAACRAVGGTEFVDACGACNPDTCDGRTSPVTAPVAVPASTPAPTAGRSEPETTPVPTYPPVSGTPAPTAGRSEPVSTPGPTYPPVSGTPAPTAGRSEPESTPAPTCQPVNSTPAPTAGRSEPVYTHAPTHLPVSSTPAPTAGRSEPVIPAPTHQPVQGTPAPTAGRSESSEIYCFPPSDERKRFTGVWDNYMLEAKDSAEDVCGPANNNFEDVLVSVNDERNELSLTYQYANGLWYGSEVRILQESGPYSYGTFTYSVKSINVIENGTVVSNVLPVGLVVGMFTWDSTYSGSDPEIYEVDIEIGQFGNSSNADAQFLLQPPEQPHYYRFWTGSEGVCEQSPQTYEFTWLPTSVAWYSSAGGGQNHLYTTQEAISTSQTDRVQCMPSSIEARASLWSIRGAEVAPDGMKENQQVQVVFDKFTFTPLGVTGVADGEACSKNCQCLSGYCQSGVCASQ
ncbi:hypothetical protein MPSEU_000605600 [Mayamaea pseudoterrestris]|nr:hypothetical protein MPSEU_000605600 [Mayamaea pseudoterrestris]